MRAEHEELRPFYVWDRVVRLTHWVVVVSIVLLAATGIYLGSPFVSVPGQAREHFVTGWAKVLHFYAAIAFTLAVLSRILWMLIGPRVSSWRQFIPTNRRRWRDLKETFLFYSFFREKPPLTRGHNPLAGAFYFGIFGLYLLMIATGLALYSVSSYSYMRGFGFLLPWFHGVQGARWIHHIGMWIVICFVVNHVYSAILTSRVEKNGAVDSIFSGYKYLPPNIPEDDE